MAKKHMKIKKGRFFSFIFLLLLVCGGIISICLFTPFFNVSEVAVSGNEAVYDEEIINSSGVVFGTNIFRVNTKKVKENLAKNPLIDKITVKRKIPNRIELVIEETSPQLIFPYMTGYVITDEKAKVCELKDAKPELVLPVISGIEIKEAKVCQTLVPADVLTFEMVMDTISLFHDYNSLVCFRSMDFTNLSNLTAVTHEGVKVIFGKMEDLEYKIKFMHSVMPNIDKAEGTYVDISSASKGIYGTLDNETPIPLETETPDGEKETEVPSEKQSDDVKETKNPDDAKEE